MTAAATATSAAFLDLLYLSPSQLPLRDPSLFLVLYFDGGSHVGKCKTVKAYKAAINWHIIFEKASGIVTILTLQKGDREIPTAS